MSLVIAIDGPAGSGKSTLAKMLADKYSILQVDSGALYRTYAWLSLKYAETAGVTDLSKILEQNDCQNHLKGQHLEVLFENGKQVIQVSQQNVEPFIRDPQITNNIKAVADAIWVRELVNQKLQNLAQKYSIVADGRDMGTEVFPRADIKLFITASLAERARRRFAEFEQKHPGISQTEVEQQIALRDAQDESRPRGALKQAEDAILIDTTSQTLDTAFNTIEQFLISSESSQIQSLIKEKKINQSRN